MMIAPAEVSSIRFRSPQRHSPVVFPVLFVLILVASALPVGANDDLAIQAPAESVFAELSYAHFPSMTIEGWACGTTGGEVGRKTADRVYRLRLAEQGFKNASAGLKDSYENRKKALKAPAGFKGLSLPEVSASIAASLSRFPNKIDAFNADLNRMQKELSQSLKEKPDWFFGVDISKRRLQENHSGDKLRLETWQDDGAYQVWSTIDCYSGADLQSMQSAIRQALEAALTARDELIQTAEQVHDGQGAAFTLPR
jgi:hypothetical protein